mgnify:CR=1 FL=1
MNLQPSDVIGQKYNRWTIISFSHSDGHHRFYNCVCECGNHGVVDIRSLRSGNSKSCGCLRREITKKRATTHGLSKSRINRIYRNMKARCYDPNAHTYRRYGANGIKMCDEWLGKDGFINFYNWAMNNGYKDNLTIDRKDGTGNYCPENCRWATPKEQSNNLRTNIVIEYNGEKHTVAEWADITGINSRTINMRYKEGLPLDIVFSRLDRRFKEEVMF